MPITSLPNLLTLSRILAIPAVIATFYVPGDYARWFACALFSAAGVTDWLDGHMARRWEQQSEIGRFLDPIADKLLVSATLFMLTAFGRLSAEALLPALVILCREILVSGLREYLAGTMLCERRTRQGSLSAPGARRTRRVSLTTLPAHRKRRRRLCPSPGSRAARPRCGRSRSGTGARHA